MQKIGMTLLYPCVTVAKDKWIDRRYLPENLAVRRQEIERQTPFTSFWKTGQCWKKSSNSGVTVQHGRYEMPG